MTRLEALEAVAGAAREILDNGDGSRALADAFRALDAIPAAPTQAQGETVDVAVWRHKNGAYGLVQIGSADDWPDGDFTRIGTTVLTIRAAEGGGE
jgi:hypothetical protein